MPFDRTAGALQDILRHIDLARIFLADTTPEQFDQDTVRVYAVTRCLEIISEASRRLPDALKSRHPDIPWREIAGAGNVYRHNYEDVVPRRVWETVWSALPALRAVVEIELAADRK